MYSMYFKTATKKEVALSSWMEESLEELKRRKQQTKKLSMTWRWIFSCLKRPAKRARRGKM